MLPIFYRRQDTVWNHHIIPSFCRADNAWGKANSIRWHAYNLLRETAHLCGNISKASESRRTVAARITKGENAGMTFMWPERRKAHRWGCECKDNLPNKAPSATGITESVRLKKPFRTVGKLMSHCLRSRTTLPERLFRASGKALPGLGKASPARRKRLYRKTEEALRQTECVRRYTP